MIVAAIIGPKTPEVAKGLISAAVSLGLSPSVVKSDENGYRVPSAVASRYEDGEPAPKKPAAKKVAKKATAKKATAPKTPEPESAGAETPDEGQE